MKQTLGIKIIFYYLSILLLIISLISIVSLIQLGGAIEVILKENILSVQAGESMMEYLNRLQMVADHDDISETDTYTREFQEAFLIAKNNITLPSEKEILDKIDVSFETYLRLLRQIQTKNAMIGASESVHLAYHESRRLIKNLLTVNHQAIVSASNNAKRLAKERSVWMMFLAVVGVVSVFGFNRVIRKRYTKPVSEMLIALRRVNFGDYDTKLMRQEGEFGELTEHVNNLIDKIQADRSSAAFFALDQRDLLLACLETFPKAMVLYAASGKMVLSNQKARALLQQKPTATVMVALKKLIDDQITPSRWEMGHQSYGVEIRGLNTASLFRIGYLISFDPIDPPVVSCD